MDEDTWWCVEDSEVGTGLDFFLSSYFSEEDKQRSGAELHTIAYRVLKERRGDSDA